MSYGGDSLNSRYLVSIDANSHKDLVNLINAIPTPNQVMFINNNGSNWYATVSLSRPIKDFNENLKKKVNNNGSSKK
jgi:hypothetical protein